MELELVVVWGMGGPLLVLAKVQFFLLFLVLFLHLSGKELNSFLKICLCSHFPQKFYYIHYSCIILFQLFWSKIYILSQHDLLNGWVFSFYVKSSSFILALSFKGLVFFSCFNRYFLVLVTQNLVNYSVFILHTSFFSC